ANTSEGNFMRTCALGVAGFLLWSFHSLATTFYVNVNNPNPVAPYTNWATAATNIVDVTDGAYYGDLVLVSNGVYHYGSSFQSGDGGTRLYVEGFTVQSVNGPAVTTIVGNPTQDSTAQRCAVVANGA